MEIVTAKTQLRRKALRAQAKQERFYDWMLRINNIYLADNEQVTKAFNKIIV